MPKIRGVDPCNLVTAFQPLFLPSVSRTDKTAQGCLQSFYEDKKKFCCGLQLGMQPLFCPPPPTPGRRPPAPRPWAQHAAACPADAGLCPGSRRDHCGPGARGHFLGSHSYSVVEPGRERTSAGPQAPGGHRKGHVASVRRTSGLQWLRCGSSC